MSTRKSHIFNPAKMLVEKIPGGNTYMSYTTQRKNGYFNPELCKECKGRGCCQHMGCFYAPSDFIVLSSGEKYSEEEQIVILAKLAEMGMFSIDAVNIRDREFGPLNPNTLKPDLEKINRFDGCLFLRARNTGRQINDFQYFMNEDEFYPCSFWSEENGCSLSDDQRPYTGRMVRPNRIRCVDETNYTDFFGWWFQHQNVLVKLSQMFDGDQRF